MSVVFTVEEISFICVYECSDRIQTIADMKLSLPDVYERDSQKAILSGIEKLEKISDEEYAELIFPHSVDLYRQEV